MEIEELRRLAAKNGLSLNYVAKDEIISILLSELQSSENIILKGGTALNRVYLKNKRFSEDIDFDVISPWSAKHTLPKTNKIISALKNVEIEKPRIMKNIIRYDVFYRNPLGHKDRVRVEFKPIKKASAYSKKIVSFGFVPHDPSLMNVYDIELLILSKAECLISRTEGKDVFDLFYLLSEKHNHVKEIRVLKEKMLQKLNMEESQIKSLANAINHYIPRDSRPKWPLFIEELKEKIRKY